MDLENYSDLANPDKLIRPNPTYTPRKSLEQGNEIEPTFWVGDLRCTLYCEPSYAKSNNWLGTCWHQNETQSNFSLLPVCTGVGNVLFHQMLLSSTQ